MPFRGIKNAVKNVIKKPVKSLTNAVKNFTPVGWANYGVKKLTGLDVVGEVGEGLDKALGGGRRGGGGGGAPGDNPFERKAAEYERQALEARTENLAANRRFTQQLEAQSRGEGPSLANAQLRATQNRNLAQTLAAAQGAGANPLATRNLLQMRGQSSRDLAELGGIQRLQEQQGAQQMLGAQLGQQANIARGDLAQGFDFARTPVDMSIQQQQFQAQLQAQRDMARRQQQSQILGGLLGAGGSIGAALISDENNKKAPEVSDATKAKKERNKRLADAVASIGKQPIQNVGEGISAAGAAFAEAIRQRAAQPPVQVAAAPTFAMPTAAPVPVAQPMTAMSDENSKQSTGNKKSKLPSASKEVNKFLDQLAARKYEYKDTSLPGTAPGERVGITAQDLEKSTLGKKLVMDTPTGKMVDTVQGFGTVLAAQAELNRRLKNLEGKKGKKES